MPPPAPLTDKERAIAGVYYHPRTGFGPAEETFQNARRVHPGLTREDVRSFLGKQEIKQRRKPQRYNSYVADFPRQEFQVDLLDMGEKSTPRYGFTAIDIFSKKGACFPLADKTAPGTAEALRKTFAELGYPSSVMCDEGGEFHADFSKLCKDEDVELLYSRTGGRFVERFIRTLKIAIFNRVKSLGGRWTQYVSNVVDKYNDSVHTTTGYKPDQIDEDQYDYPLLHQVHDNITKHAKFNANHPALNVGDRVKIRVKPRGYSDYKETFNSWSHEVYTVGNVTDEDAGLTYHLTGYRRPLLRFELLKVEDVHRWRGDQLHSVLHEVQEPKPALPAPVEGAAAPLPRPRRPPPPIFRPGTRSRPSEPLTPAIAAHALRRSVTTPRAL